MVKTHMGPILCISTGVAGDAASKRRLAEALVRDDLTGSGRHFSNVKIISWISLNGKLVDFKGGNELMYAPEIQNNGPPLHNRGDKRERASTVM